MADQEHQHVAKQALGWQETAGHGVFWEIGAEAPGRGEGRVYALAGQMASAGEQLSLAHAAAVEVALWREVREKADPDASHEMFMRAMAEAQSLFVMGTGHALANVVAQSTRVQEVIQLVKPVADFGLGQRWQDLSERRGEDFHRWRPQTHGIQGLPRTSPWVRTGRSQVLNLGHPTYDEARGRADETARLASEAMMDLALSMEASMEGSLPAPGDHAGANPPRDSLATSRSRARHCTVT